MTIRKSLLKRNQKKSQVTTFIIVGIILLFASATIFFIRGKINEKVIESDLRITENIPLELNPFRAYVETCMDSLLVDSIKKIGLHGGYAEINNPIYSNRVFDIGGSPTESDAVEFMLAGASAVSLGTVNFLNPKASIHVTNGIERYMLDNKINFLKSIVGKLKL